MDKTKEIKQLKSTKAKAHARGNVKELGLTCNYLGNVYQEAGMFSDALDEHKEELSCFRRLNDELGVAVAYRRIGECYAAMGDMRSAINYTKMYLDKARKASDLVELQRAWATIGRIYFMQYSDDPKKYADALNMAEEAQLKALAYIDKIKGVKDLKDRDFAEMRCRAYLNLGLIYEHKDDENECSKCYNYAITLAKKNTFTEDLNRCEASLAAFYTKIGRYSLALKMYCNAVLSAKQLKNNALLYEMHMSKGQVHLHLQDYEGARRAFKKAYFIYGRRSSENETAKKFCKLVVKAIKNIRKLDDEEDIEEKIKFCDQLGDIFCELECYSIGITYYAQELDFSKKAGKDKEFLSMVYLSLAQTYQDNHQYNEALENYAFEMSCYDEKPEEVVRITLKMIEVYGLQNRSNEDIIEEYRKLLAKCAKKLPLLRDVYDQFSSFLANIVDCRDIYADLEKEIHSKLRKIRSRLSPEKNLDSDDEKETSLELDISEMSDLTSESEDENSEEYGRPKRRRGKRALESKRSDFGDTPLHLACAQGNMRELEMLLNKGHKVNVRDNAGWLPIHDAAFHGQAEAVEALIRNKAAISDSGGKESRGRTPLHEACGEGHVNVIEILVKAGANVVAVDWDGLTPVDRLREYYNFWNSKNKFNPLERKSCQLWIERLETEMKKRGYDAKKALKRPFTCLEINESTETIIDDDLELLASPPRKSSCTDVSRGPSMRRNADPSSDAFRAVKTMPKPIQATDENFYAGDDWLDDDLGIAKDLTKSNKFVDLYEMKKINERPCSAKVLKRKTIEEDSDNESIQEDYWKRSTFLKTSSQLRHEDPEIQTIEENDVSFGKKIKETKSRIKDYEFNKTNSIKEEKIQQSTGGKLKVRVHIDGLILLVPMAGAENPVSALEAKIIERYFKMKKMRVKIMLSTMDGALLSAEDSLEDVLINDEVKAEIQCYDICPIHELYTIECKGLGLQPMNELLSEMKLSIDSGSLNLSNCRVSSLHYKALVNALKLQKKLHRLDLSFSNLLHIEQGIDIIKAIGTLETLEHLNLSGTTILNTHLKALSRLSMPNLNELNMNYNYLQNEKEEVINIIKNFTGLTSIYLQFCDLTSDLLTSLSFNQIIEYRKITVHIDPFVNDIAVGEKTPILQNFVLPKVNQENYKQFLQKLFVRNR